MEVSIGERDLLWEELIPEILALVFKKMSFQEVLTVVPAVCKSWRKVAIQPDFWQEIDIEEWCRRCKQEKRDRMLKMLVSRSRGSLRKLSVCGLNDQIFPFIAECAQSLQTLRMPLSEVTDPIAIPLAPKLATLTYLDISYIRTMTSSSLEALGKHCKFLTRLNRNMPSWSKAFIGAFPQDDEAFAVAKYMGRLKHLELSFGEFTDAGLKAILSNCKQLQHLDIRGCRNVAMQDSLAEQCQKLKVFMSPFVDDNFVCDFYNVEEPTVADYFRSLDLDERIHF